MLSWEVPESDGGSPITGYFVERRITSSSRWLRINKDRVEELTITDTELIEDSEYEYRVLAVNKIGEGPPSTPTPPFVAKDPWGKPGKPGTPEFSDIKDGKISLKWTAPEDDGGAPITNYVLEYRAEGAFKWLPAYENKPNPECKYTIKGLKDDELYEFRVAAENKAGVGPCSDNSMQVAAKEPVGE